MDHFWTTRLIRVGNEWSDSWAESMSIPWDGCEGQMRDHPADQTRWPVLLANSWRELRPTMATIPWWKTLVGAFLFFAVTIVLVTALVVSAQVQEELEESLPEEKETAQVFQIYPIPFFT